MPDEPNRPPREEPEDADAWEEVRESWVGDPPPQALEVQVVLPPTDLGSLARRKSSPPLVAVRWIETPPAPPGLTDEEIALLCDDLMDAGLKALSSGDFEGAAIAAATVLQERPEHPDAIQCAEMAHKELLQMYEARIGSRMKVPHLVQGRTPQDVDDVAKEILHRIDGRGSIDQIIEHANLPLIGSLRAITELYLGGFLRLQSP
jgi:hypothetical protein